MAGTATHQSQTADHQAGEGHAEGLRKLIEELIVTHDENGRTRTRIVVTPRSYLDGGTEVLPGQRKFTDYAIPPFSRPTDVLGPRWTFDRQPLNPIWEQGWTRGWY